MIACLGMKQIYRKTLYRQLDAKLEDWAARSNTVQLIRKTYTSKATIHKIRLIFTCILIEMITLTNRHCIDWPNTSYFFTENLVFMCYYGNDSTLPWYHSKCMPTARVASLSSSFTLRLKERGEIIETPHFATKIRWGSTNQSNFNQSKSWAKRPLIKLEESNQRFNGDICYSLSLSLTPSM